MHDTLTNIFSLYFDFDAFPKCLPPPPILSRPGLSVAEKVRGAVWFDLFDLYFPTFRRPLTGRTSSKVKTLSKIFTSNYFNFSESFPLTTALERLARFDP